LENFISRCLNALISIFAKITSKVQQKTFSGTACGLQDDN